MRSPGTYIGTSSGVIFTTRGRRQEEAADQPPSLAVVVRASAVRQWRACSCEEGSRSCAEWPVLCALHDAHSHSGVWTAPKHSLTRLRTPRVSSHVYTYGFEHESSGLKLGTCASLDLQSAINALSDCWIDAPSERGVRPLAVSLVCQKPHTSHRTLVLGGEKICIALLRAIVESWGSDTMLHEVLLALSGHPSPLFAEQPSKPGAAPSEDFPLLSPSERALLRSIGRLSQLHRRLKRHLRSVSSNHTSIICKAVAASILQTHLARFQQRILDVESKILKQDVSLVGAYEIVPLAAVVGEFDDWHRRMAWYWEVACFMLAPTDFHRSASSPTIECTSARLIDKLRAEAQTGYPEIEEAATELSRVAETSWLRQLSSWIIYGKLPSLKGHDFFIHTESREDHTFKRQNDLLPDFVNQATASSIFFIGKSLNQAQNLLRTNHDYVALSEKKGDIASDHLRMLSSLSLPIIPSQLSRTIAAMRLSLSQNVLQHLLPMEVTLKNLSCLRHFLLFAHGEFAASLITEAESRLQARQQSMGSLLSQDDPAKALQGLSIKDAELSQSLQQVWRSLAAEDTEVADELLQHAQTCISLAAPKANISRPSTSTGPQAWMPEMAMTSFNDLLFPSPTQLSMTVTSPLDLFLSSQDVSIYSKISSYLLAIRRGHHRLSELWRRTPARRDHPVATANSGTRSRRNKRNTTTRKVWATCSAAIFLLSESSAFFEGEIVKISCDHFQEWVESPAPTYDPEKLGDSVHDDPSSTAQRDPETSASGHRTFLAALTYALLLTDEPYTKEFRSLLGNIDSLIAFFSRLLDIQQKLDLEDQTDGESSYTAQEEQIISLELDRARKKVDSDLKSVVNRLKQLDHERIGSMRYLDVRAGQKGDFEVWKGGGVDRLLMKLEFGRMARDAYEIDIV